MFAFDLAKELRCPNVDAMLASIPLPLFFEWLDYAKRQPFGEQRADLRIGFAAAKLAALWTGKGHKPADFMPRFDGFARPKQAPAQMLAVLKGVVQLHKGEADRMKARKALKTPETYAKGPGSDDRGSDGLLDPKNA